MKKTIAFGILLVMLALTACGQTAPAAAPASEPAAEPQQEVETVQIPNPWRDVTEAEAKALCPGSLTVPDGAENPRWSVMETAGAPALVQLDFNRDGYSYTAREQATGDRDADISGMFYTWTEQTEMTLSNWEESAKSGTCFRYIGENEWVDLCTWYDTAKGISYSLSVTAKDLDGFDLQAVAEALCVPAAAPAETGRQDGERFDAVIILEGMEETVHYEHVRNVTLGFEMDYDYESLVRRSEADRECFVSAWDLPDAPENYLELSYRVGDAESVAAAVREELSGTYDLLEESRELERAGSCLYIEAAVLKGTNNMADQLQMVYIIPTADGCIVARVHCAAEAAEGFARRCNYMIDTISTL